MFNETHELVEEFPDFKDLIHRLKMTNSHFVKLFEEYHRVTRAISRIEQQIETTSDEMTEKLKKRRLFLKDELFGILRRAA